MAFPSRKSPLIDQVEPVAPNVVLKKPNRRPSLGFLSLSAASAILTCLAYLIYRASLTWAADGSTVMWMVLLVEILTAGTRRISLLSEV